VAGGTGAVSLSTFSTIRSSDTPSVFSRLRAFSACPRALNKPTTVVSTLADPFDVSGEVLVIFALPVLRRRELKTTRDKLATLRAQHSETQYKLTQLEGEQQKPGIELKFETQQSSFTLRDMHPDAAAAWKRFVDGVLEAPQDETATMLLTAGTA
jgi:hypothetical protein